MEAKYWRDIQCAPNVEESPTVLSKDKCGPIISFSRYGTTSERARKRKDPMGDEQIQMFLRSCVNKINKIDFCANFPFRYMFTCLSYRRFRQNQWQSFT